jgi:hypothetical protein
VSFNVLFLIGGLFFGLVLGLVFGGRYGFAVGRLVFGGGISRWRIGAVVFGAF